MKEEVFLPLAIFFLVWNLFLSFLVGKIMGHYRRLVKGSKKENLEKILERILKESAETKRVIKEIKRKAEELGKKQEGDFQRFGLVKFNPFSEVGGNHSFSLALLDGHNSGLVITGLHSREATRIYTKKIKEGKPVEGELSKEEKLAVEKAVKG